MFTGLYYCLHFPLILYDVSNRVFGLWLRLDDSMTLIRLTLAGGLGVSLLILVQGFYYHIGMRQNVNCVPMDSDAAEIRNYHSRFNWVPSQSSLPREVNIRSL